MKQCGKLAAAALAALLCVAATPANGEWTPFLLEGLSMQISLPDGMAVFTGDAASGEDALREAGYSAGFAMQYIQQTQGLYLVALPDDQSYEVFVAAEETEAAREYWDFAAYSETTLRRLANQWQSARAGGDEAMEYTARGVLFTGAAAFVQSSYRLQAPGDEDAWCHAYETVHNGQYITLVLCSRQGPITEAQEQRLAAMAKTVLFTNTLPNPAPQSGTGGVPVAVWWGAAGLLCVCGCLLLVRRRAAKQPAPQDECIDHELL